MSVNNSTRHPDSSPKYHSMSIKHGHEVDDDAFKVVRRESRGEGDLSSSKPPSAVTTVTTWKFPCTEMNVARNGLHRSLNPVAVVRVT